MKISRRSWFGQSVLTALAALLPWKASANPLPEDTFFPLDTGLYTRVFRRDYVYSPDWKYKRAWVEIEWEQQHPGDEVIHFGYAPDCPLLCVKGVIHSIDQHGTITWNGPYTDIPKL